MKVFVTDLKKARIFGSPGEPVELTLADGSSTTFEFETRYSLDKS